MVQREKNRKRSCRSRSSSSNVVSSAAAETIANNVGLLEEILVRVPARPLVRFKCVSKRWLSLISDPKFCDWHTLQNPSSCSVASAVFSGCSETKLGFSFIPLDYDGRPSGAPGSRWKPPNLVPNEHDIRIFQSCNGLFLCYLDKFEYFYVVNPTTNQFLKIIPPTAATTRATGLISYALAFDPSKSPHYKVLCLRSTDGTAFGSYYHHIEIYSSETRSWRLLDSTFLKQPVDYITPVYCNGAIHWSGWNAQLSYYHMDEERVGWVDSPPFYEPFERDDGEDTYFFETPGGHLHLARVYWRCQTQFDVLEMGRNYSGWFVKYHVDLVHDPPIPIPDLLQWEKSVGNMP
ncbi:F-box protein [Prunus yedoensis var. nudiflora]|uniref:F-box protein n=1 Tax=Prunus yedoensis var. nudiflora TaxID=2094558 RepID=A0A314UYB1_PRUYE|nr:F-box protein [Prunus yedoensis var. nudiflora]